MVWQDLSVHKSDNEGQADIDAFRGRHVDVPHHSNGDCHDRNVGQDVQSANSIVECALLVSDLVDSRSESSPHLVDTPSGSKVPRRRQFTLQPKSND